MLNEWDSEQMPLNNYERFSYIASEAATVHLYIAYVYIYIYIVR